MAQHIPVKGKLPEPVEASIARVAKYVHKNKLFFTTFVKQFVYRKTAMLLSTEYAELTPGAVSAVNVGTYLVKLPDLTGNDKPENLTFECHLDNNGNVLEIYLPY